MAVRNPSGTAEKGVLQVEKIKVADDVSACTLNGERVCSVSGCDGDGPTQKNNKKDRDPVTGENAQNTTLQIASDGSSLSAVSNQETGNAEEHIYGPMPQRVDTVRRRDTQKASSKANERRGMRNNDERRHRKANEVQRIRSA